MTSQPTRRASSGRFSRAGYSVTFRLSLTRRFGNACIALVFAGIDFGVMLGDAEIGARAVKLLRRNTVLWLDRCCGGALLALAGSLAFYRRGTS